MLKTPKISIIVPVYNSSKYLCKCLDTLKYQIYENIEIVCIDDGSDDNCLEILNKYAQGDYRFKVLSQTNKGQSAARNYGMSVATGDYLSFIDSDDWVYLTLYQTFVDTLNRVNKDIDIWMFNISTYIQGKNDVIQNVFFNSSDWNNHFSDDVVHTFDDCMCPFSRNISAANKIYKKSFLENLNLTFPEGLKYEDQYFSLKAFLNANSIMFTEDVFYRYRNEHETSISKAVSEKVFDIFKIMDLIEAEILKLNFYDSYKYALFQYKYNLFMQHFLKCPENLKDKFYDEMKRRVLAASKNNINMSIASRLSNFIVFEKVRDNNRNDFEKYLKEHLQ